MKKIALLLSIIREAKMKMAYLLLVCCMVVSCLVGCNRSGLDQEALYNQEASNPTETSVFNEGVTAPTQVTEVNGFVGEVTPPGTLRDPQFIPQPEKHDIGVKVDVDAEGLVNIVLDSAERTFVYVWSHEKEQGRLVVFSNPNPETGYTTVWIYAPSFFGGSGLCAALQNGFSMEIVDVINITFEEGMYIHNSTFYNEEYLNELNGDEIISIDSSAGMSSGKTEYYFGFLTKGNSNNKALQKVSEDISVFLAANLSEVDSERMKSNIDVFTRIVYRFSLTDVLGL